MLVRSHVEYANSVWSPIRMSDIVKIEKVQQRATKIICGDRSLSYEQRLRQLRLPTLTYRRFRGDMIELFKIITGKYDASCSLNFSFRSEIIRAVETRGNIYKLVPHHCKYELRKHFFINRVVPIWNNLPNDVVVASSVNSFKSRLDKFWLNREFVYNYRAQPLDTGNAKYI